MTAGVASQQQAVARETLERSLGWKKTSVVLQRTGIFKTRRQLRDTLHNAIQIEAGIVITIRMQDTHSQAHPSVATRKRPGIAMGREGTPHDQEELVLGIIGRVEVVLRTIPIAVKGLTHLGPHADMTRETTGIDGHVGVQADPLANMILRGDACNLPILQQGLLDGMPDTDRCAGRYCASGQMLIHAAHVDDTGYRGIVLERHFTMRREKYDFANGVIELLRNR